MSTGVSCGTKDCRGIAPSTGPHAGTCGACCRQAAGERYDAAVRAIWAKIPRELGTREAWALAKPGMAAAQAECERELAAERAEREAAA